MLLIVHIKGYQRGGYFFFYLLRQFLFSVLMPIATIVGKTVRPNKINKMLTQTVMEFAFSHIMLNSKFIERLWQ